MKSINKDEAKNWLIDVKRSAPDFIFNALLELTETYLPNRFKAEVQDAVHADKVPAPVS
ncbi:hypothetical protein BH11BAC4_BH11BAC4_05120 [soil metagenome]